MFVQGNYRLDIAEDPRLLAVDVSGPGDGHAPRHAFGWLPFVLLLSLRHIRKVGNGQGSWDPFLLIFRPSDPFPLGTSGQKLPGEGLGRIQSQLSFLHVRGEKVWREKAETTWQADTWQGDCEAVWEGTGWEEDEQEEASRACRSLEVLGQIFSVRADIRCVHVLGSDCFVLDGPFGGNSIDIYRSQLGHAN